MITEISVTLRRQDASEGCWLWQDQGEDVKRYFTKFVYLAPNDTEWPECTNEEKERYELEWEVAHNPVTTEGNETD